MNPTIVPPPRRVPLVSRAVLTTVLTILLVEGVIGLALWQLWDLGRAISNAAARYEGGVERLATYQQECP